MSADETLKRAEDLLARLERTRQDLAATEDPDRAVEILNELAQIAKEVESELTRARHEVRDAPE